jgi:hypothetical protein
MGRRSSGKRAGVDSARFARQVFAGEAQLVDCTRYMAVLNLGMTEVSVHVFIG